MAGTDIAPAYPGTEIDPGASASSSAPPRGSRGKGKLGKLWSTPGGRATLAGAAAVVLVLMTLLRNRSASSTASDTTTSTTAADGSSYYADPLAGLGTTEDLNAPDVPSGGFDFTGGGAVFNPTPGVGTTYDPVETDPSDPTVGLPPTVHVVIDLPPVQPAAGPATSAPVAPAPIAPVPASLPEGYYRGAWTSGFTYQDGKGHSISKALSDAARAGIAAKDAAMKKSPVPSMAFVIDGRGHTLTKDGRIRPTAAVGVGGW